MAPKKSRAQIEFHERIGASVIPRSVVAPVEQKSFSGVVILAVSAVVIILAVLWAVRLAAVSKTVKSSVAGGTMIALAGQYDESRREDSARLAVSKNQDLLLQRRRSISQFQETNQEPLQAATPMGAYQSTASGYGLQGSVGTAAVR